MQLLCRAAVYQFEILLMFSLSVSPIAELPDLEHDQRSGQTGVQAVVLQYIYKGQAYHIFSSRDSPHHPSLQAISKLLSPAYLRFMLNLGSPFVFFFLSIV